MVYSLVSEALQPYASAVSLLVLYLRTTLYQRHKSIVSVLFPWGVVKSCISRFSGPGIRPKLFLTSLLNDIDKT